MLQNVLFNLSALVALMPATLLAYVRDGFRQGKGPDMVFWAVLAVAAAGPLTWALVQLDGTWRTGISTTLWVSIAACMVLFTGLCLTTRSGWRLMPLLLPYLLLVGLFATATAEARDPTLSASAPTVWVDLHITVSVTTYALLTLAAVAALAAFLQERALKAKRPTALTRMLPPMADSEQLQGRLLIASEIVLGLGLITGMSVLYFEQGILFRVRPQDSLVCRHLCGHWGAADCPRRDRCARSPGSPLRATCLSFAHFGLSGRKIRHGHFNFLNIFSSK